MSKLVNKPKAARWVRIGLFAILLITSAVLTFYVTRQEPYRNSVPRTNATPAPGIALGLENGEPESDAAESFPREEPPVDSAIPEANRTPGAEEQVPAEGKPSRAAGESSDLSIAAPRNLETLDEAAKQNPHEQAKQARYERLLAKYLAHIEIEAKRYRDRGANLYVSAYKKRPERLRKLAESKEELQRRLQDLGPAGIQDDFGVKVGRPSLHDWIDGGSGVSAEAFVPLYRKGVLTAEDLLQPLFGPNTAMGFHPEWQSFLEQVLAESEPGSFLEVKAAATLVCGGERNARTIEVLKAAVFSDDPTDARCLLAAEPLLFDYDPATGQTVPWRTDQARGILDEVLNNVQSPSTLSVCGKYAATIGDRVLAEELCRSLFECEYLEIITEPIKPKPREDVILSRARQEALYCFFYEISTEAAFRYIFDLAYKARDYDYYYKPDVWIVANPYRDHSSLANDVKIAASFVQKVEQRFNRE